MPLDEIDEIEGYVLIEEMLVDEIEGYVLIEEMLVDEIEGYVLIEKMLVDALLANSVCVAEYLVQQGENPDYFV